MISAGEKGDLQASKVIGCLPIRLEDEHLAELLLLVEQLPRDANEKSAEERNLERFEKLVSLYSGEPQLLDCALPSLVTALLRHIPWPHHPSDPDQPPSALLTSALIRLRVLSVVRGHHFLMRLLPHEFEMLEPVLSCLECFTTKSAQNVPNSSKVDKRLVHILTVWLTIICKNPFRLNRMAMNQGQQTQEEQQQVEQRIITCMDRLQREMVIAGELTVVTTLLAQILTRNRDNREQLRHRFDEFQRIFVAFESELNGGQTLINQLRLIIALFKWGRQPELRPFALELLRSLPPQILKADCPNILVRNLVARLIHRVALVLLRPRLASWRYSCGYRSLEDNLGARKDQTVEGPCEQKKPAEHETERKGQQEEEQGDEQQEEVPLEEIGKLVGHLLEKVCDRDNMVRWTAAKGIARICARIPHQMAADVVSSLIRNTFATSTGQEANTWHGGCLALAELLRRGCLLPEQVVRIIQDILSPALTFEQSQLGFMQAVNVRDAACYICWAFARAYEPNVLRPHLLPLAGVLVSITLFDREVNIRRAASAAFQENVGRNGSFPNGIAILSIIDYAGIARIRHCYSELAVEVAKFGAYVRPMLDHLCQLKSRHWDEAVRELAAEALQRLAPFDSEYVYKNILPTFFARIRSSDPAEKHGAFFSISALLVALRGDHDVFIHRELLLGIISDNFADLDHRNRHFALVAKSLCFLIDALCSIGCELTDQQLAQLHDILDALVADDNKDVVARAMSAFSALMSRYEGERLPLLLDRVQNKYFDKIVTPCLNESLRCSSIVPLGYIHPNFLLSPGLRSSANGTSAEVLADSIVKTLMDAIQDSRTPKWVNARVASIQCICAVLEKCEPPGFSWAPLIDCFALASDDYTTTTNGDIGRFARRAAVKALALLLPLAYSSAHGRGHPPPLTQHQLNNAIGKMVERACESIDDLRAKACIALRELARFNDAHPLSAAIAELTLLRSIFIDSSSDDSVDVDWRHAQGFVRLAPLLASPIYGHNALMGFVLSAGSVCSWISQHAFLAIVTHLRPHKQDVQSLEQFLASLLSVHSAIVARHGDPSPVFVLFRMLLNDQQLQRLEQHPDQFSHFTELCELTLRLALGKGKPKVKALAVSVLGSLLQLDRQSQMHKRVLRMLLSLLGSPYGSLREQAAEQLFESLSLLDSAGAEDGEETNIGTVLELLSQTDWSGRQADEEALASARTQIGRLLLNLDKKMDSPSPLNAISLQEN